MAQIAYDVARGSKIATAFGGTVGFANNIRAFAGLSGFTKYPAIQQGLKGDVICDDVSYLDEPDFSDGIIAQAVNDVVTSKVTYSSSANNWGTDGIRLCLSSAGERHWSEGRYKFGSGRDKHRSHAG